MLSYEITSVVGKHKARKRVGRGPGSGHGKTSTRGHKGSLSRAGAGTRLTYEGGSMPLFRRIPKRGFSNFQFETRYAIVNLWQLDSVFENGAAVGIEQMVEAGLVSSAKSKVKILGDGELSKKLTVTAHKFSKAAQQKIVDIGGSAKVVA
jgi:large subunit ribosomal protein L15